MRKLITASLLLLLFSTFLFIPYKNVYAESVDFEIGPDGDAYAIVDCSIPENNTNPEICFNTSNPTGAISWESARNRAQNMTFRGFSCDLASPSTEEVNDFLKSLPGFFDACNDDCNFSGLPPLELCGIFGGQNESGSGTEGPYTFVNDPDNNIPCPFDGAGECDPVIEEGVGTDLTFQDWCRVENGCGANEPNNAGDLFMGYVFWPGENVVGWSDCDNACNLSVTNDCQHTTYFVECELPPPTPAPTISQWGMIAFGFIAGLFGLWFLRRRVKIQDA